MAEPLEVSEAAATGEIARIYADIRSTLAVPMVNAIFRRIAVEPEALDWAWTTLKPRYADGQVANIAEQLAREAERGPWPFRAHLACRDRNEMHEVLHVIQNYNHSNSLNLAALTCLRMSLAASAAEARLGSSRISPKETHASNSGPDLAVPADCSAALRRVLHLQGVDRFNLTPTMKHTSDFYGTGRRIVDYQI